MKVKELLTKLRHVDPDASVSVTIDRNPDGLVAITTDVVDILDDGDIVDLFINVTDADWKRGF